MQLAPKQAGLSPERLDSITRHLDKHYIAPGKIAGCQTLVARHGHVAYFQSLGDMDRERARPMAGDTIFRIYSMSKPITSVALMTLYEQGHFQLNDPVHKFIPEWRDHRVWVSGEGAGMETLTFDLLADLANVQCPTLVLGGEDDPITPIESQEDIASALPQHLVRFERFAHAGHGPFRDDPRGYDVIRDFILS
jgi:pimeloyl-ACP methyl ester carboxylesterase